MTNKIPAIVLARGGSKEIPRKNLIEFCGKPLLFWTIEQCKRAELIESVWVSSDDDEILYFAENQNVNTIKRPDQYSGDDASSEVAWLHAVEYLKKRNVNCDTIICPQVTSPLRRFNDIDDAIKKFYKDKLDSLFSASVWNDLYFWQIDSNGSLSSVNYDYENRKRRQCHEDQIVENGSFYIFKTELLEKRLNRFGEKIGISKMLPWQIFEIDNEYDIKICSVLMSEFIIGVKND